MHTSKAAYWLAIAFVPHFWPLLSLRSVEAVVTIQPKIECSRSEDNSAGRKRLALDCYRRVPGERVAVDLFQEEEKGFSKPDGRRNGSSSTDHSPSG